jgi:hypothetical protein
MVRAKRQERKAGERRGRREGGGDRRCGRREGEHWGNQAGRSTASTKGGAGERREEREEREFNVRAGRSAASAARALLAAIHGLAPTALIDCAPKTLFTCTPRNTRALTQGLEYTADKTGRHLLSTSRTRCVRACLCVSVSMCARACAIQLCVCARSDKRTHSSAHARTQGVERCARACLRGLLAASLPLTDAKRRSFAPPACLRTRTCTRRPHAGLWCQPTSRPLETAEELPASESVRSVGASRLGIPSSRCFLHARDRAPEP